MGRRGALEQDRAGLLQRAGAVARRARRQVTLERLCALVTPGAAERRPRALRRAARPARRDRPRARHQPRADAPGARLPLPPHPARRQRDRARLPGPGGTGTAAPADRRPSTTSSTSRRSHADLLLLRPPDLAARAARPAAGAGHHRPQHRQRLDGRATRARRPLLVASPALLIPAGGVANGGRRAASAPASTSRPTAASATASSTSSTAPRPPTSARGPPAPRRSTAPSWRCRARRERHQPAARRVLGRLVGPRQRARPTTRRAPGAGRAGQRARRRLRAPSTPSSTTCADAGARRVRRPRTSRRPRRPGRRGRPDRHGDRAASTTRSSARSPPATSPNDLLDRRDLLLDQLVRVRPGLRRGDRHDGTVNVSFVDAAAAGDHLPDRRRRHRDLGRPARRRRLGARRPPRRAARRRPSPAARSTSYRTALDAVAAALDRRRQRRLRRHLPRDRPPARPARPARRRRARRPSRGSIVAGSRRRGANDIALAVAAAARRRRRRRRLPRASSPASAPRCARPSARRPTREALTDAVEDRRQSVAGVSLDEEMTQPRALPARLPGLLARDVDDGRDARRADQPHRPGGALMSTRITTG